VTESPAPGASRGVVRRRTLAVVFAGFCAFLTLYAPQPLLPLLASAFQVSARAATRVVAASTLAIVLAAPLVGALADRFGRKRVIVWSALLLSIPTMLAATADGLGQLLVWRFWQGVFTPGVFAVTVAYINEEWADGAGSAMAAYVGGTVLGGFSGRMIAAFVAAETSWRWSFAVLGVVALLCAVGMWAWLPPESRAAQPRPAREMARAMLRHLRNPRLAATYAVGFCVLFTLLGTFTYVNFYLAAPPFRLGTRALGLVFTVYLAGAVFTPIAGRAIDRMGHRFALTMGMAIAASGLALTLAPHLASVLAGLAMCCTGAWIAQSAASSYIGTVAREARAAAVGLYVMFYYLGGSFGSELPGRFWSWGGWPATVGLMVAVQFVTVALATAFWRPQAARDAIIPSRRGV